MDIDQYLRRINYEGDLNPDEDTLRALQFAHLHAVPFENYSIHSNEPIVLEEDALFEKVVARRRGGFCYELNGLFSLLLTQLGFKVQLLSAGVMSASGEYGPEFDHLALKVDLEESWLVDVGFGDCFVEPLWLQERGNQVRGNEVFRLEEVSGYLVLKKIDARGAWSPMYRLTLKAWQLTNFEAMCHYHQTSPDSPFTRKKICSMATPDGRVTLSGTRLLRTRNGVQTEKDIANNAALNEALKDNFQMKAPNGLDLFG